LLEKGEGPKKIDADMQAFRKTKRDRAQARAAAKAKLARERRDREKTIALAQVKALADLLAREEEGEDARLRRRVAGPVDVTVTSLYPPSFEPHFNPVLTPL
jgi:hypothetical protein